MGLHSVAPMPADEADRQSATDRSNILNHGRDPALFELVARAAAKFQASIAAISIIDRNRQWFAVGVGLDTDETPRDVSFCAHAIHRPGELLVVPDATKDARFNTNPLVTGAPGIRFYAGKPLITQDGYPLGTLCIIDTKPRPASPDLYELTFLAFQAERHIRSWR